MSLPRIAFKNFTLSDLENDFSGGEGASRMSYAVSRAFVRDIFQYRGDLKEFIGLVGNKGSFEKTFLQYFNVSPEILFERWAKKLPWWGPLFSLLASTSSIWSAVLLLFLLASFVTLRRRRYWKKKWEEEEKKENEKIIVQ